MPCDSIRTVSLELKVADRGVLLRGLKAAGFTVNEYGETITAYKSRVGSCTIRDGRIEVEAGRESIVNEVKRAYAKEAVQTAAKRFNWGQKVDTQDANHLTLNRRTF